MTNANTGAAIHDKADEAKPTSRVKGGRAAAEQRFISDERRVLDALEDDEVRESLKASRKLSP